MPIHVRERAPHPAAGTARRPGSPLRRPAAVAQRSLSPPSPVWEVVQPPKRPGPAASQRRSMGTIPPVTGRKTAGRKRPPKRQLERTSTPPPGRPSASLTEPGLGDTLRKPAVRSRLPMQRSDSPSSLPDRLTGSPDPVAKQPTYSWGEVVVRAAAPRRTVRRRCVSPHRNGPPQRFRGPDHRMPPMALGRDLLPPLQPPHSGPRIGPRQGRSPSPAAMPPPPPGEPPSPAGAGAAPGGAGSAPTGSPAQPAAAAAEAAPAATNGVAHPPLYTVVLDLDETLVSHLRPGQITQRPYLRQMLQRLRGHCELVLWTASTEQTGGLAVDAIDPERNIFDWVIFRHAAWFTDHPHKTHAKNLKLLGRDLDRTIIIENSANCVRWNKPHAVLVKDFEPKMAHSDRQLYRLTELLEELLRSDLPVPAYLSRSRHVEPVSLYRRDRAGRAARDQPTGEFWFLRQGHVRSTSPKTRH
eukprot:TRINITY_DN11855_c0_g1_i1.p1 TRINITY_DN11855_c0_g1~~TRINITY_DN11855_c0_g1_i1.p1  ORF type:complete len:469 (+),score=68.98 TRINITY_DN11855_c0_g1_i1:112-1518(+)